MSLEEKVDELLATVRQVKDRQDIIDCIQREAEPGDRQDAAQITSCWWEDGVDEHGPVITRVPDYAERANLGHSMNFNMTSHNITNQIVEIDGDTAWWRILCDRRAVLARRQTTTIAFGRYLDQLERAQMANGAC